MTTPPVRDHAVDDARGIVIGVGGLLVLTLLGGAVRRTLIGSTRTPADDRTGHPR